MARALRHPCPRRRHVTGALAAALVLAGCAGGDRKPPVPTATPADPTSCAVLAGGGIGSTFADASITRFWYEVNKQVTDSLNVLLVGARYRVVRLIVPVEETRSNEQWVLQGLARHRCNRLIQISHAVNEDAVGKFFRFDVTVMHLERRAQPAGATGATAVTVGDFSREYRYPRTQASFETFHTGTFASTVFADLERSGVLAPLR